mgnify:CR=1 FL=1
MGVESDGVLFRSQRNAWPAQLAEIAGVPFTVPEIASPGCFSPLKTPLRRQERLDGTARTQYRRRIEELRAEIDDALDAGRVEAIAGGGVFQPVPQHDHQRLAVQREHPGVHMRAASGEDLRAAGPVVSA